MEAPKDHIEKDICGTEFSECNKKMIEKNALTENPWVTADVIHSFFGAEVAFNTDDATWVIFEWSADCSEFFLKILHGDVVDDTQCVAICTSIGLPRPCPGQVPVTGYLAVVLSNRLTGYGEKYEKNIHDTQFSDG